MKRVIATTMILMLFGSTAAMADGWRHDQYRERGYSHRDHDNAGAAVAFGLGAATLAIIASNHNRDRGYYNSDRGYYYGGSGYYNGRNRGYYNNGYGNGYYQNDGYYRHHDEDDGD